MEELAELKRQLTEQRPADWDKLPDIPLYLDQAMADAADHLDPDTPDQDLPRLVLELAMRSYANGLACHRALAILARRTGHEDLLKKKK